MATPVDCGAGDHLGSLVSVIVAYGVAGIPLLCSIGFALWRTVHHNRAAKRYRKLAAPSQLSKAVRALRGIVAIGDGIPFAVRVELHQHGRTRTHKKQTYHEWHETSRQVDVRPFHVRTTDGSLVQVDAGATALLCIPFQRTSGDADDRVLVAQLGDGQEVTVVGRVFERAAGRSASIYRGGTAPTLLVRAPANERLVISTRPVAEAFRARMNLHARWLAIAVITAVVVHLAILSPYHVRQFVGEKTTVLVAAKRISGSGKSTTYLVETRRESGSFLPEQAASLRCYEAIRPGDRIEAVIVPGNPWGMQLGGKATAHMVSLMISAAAALIVAGVYRLQLRTKGPWFLRKRVDMRGKGPANPADLPET
jgi:hypothetical protein